jgi:hypothetical protein
MYVGLCFYNCERPVTDNYVASYVNWSSQVLWINFVSASIKGQLPYKRQKACSQCVRYSEVLLYTKFSLIILHKRSYSYTDIVYGQGFKHVSHNTLHYATPLHDTSFSLKYTPYSVKYSRGPIFVVFVDKLYCLRNRPVK